MKLFVVLITKNCTTVPATTCTLFMPVYQVQLEIFLFNILDLMNKMHIHRVNIKQLGKIFKRKIVDT